MNPTDLGLLIMAGMLIVPAGLVLWGLSKRAPRETSPYPTLYGSGSSQERRGQEQPGLDFLSIDQVDIHKRSNLMR